MAPAEPEPGLAGWLAQQRWYGAKGARIARLEIADRAVLGAGNELQLLQVHLEGGETQRYALPSHAGDRDGLGAEGAQRLWFELLAAGAERGRVRFEPLAPLPAPGSSRLLGAEQSNTSVLYRDAGGEPRWLMKFFRRVQAGENPEFEIPRALALHTGFRQVPEVLGRVVYNAGGETMTLASLQAYIPNLGDGWEYLLRRLRSGASAADCEPELALLGRRTAGLHAALAAIVSEPGFAPEAITGADIERWRRRALAAVDAADGADAALLAPWRQRLLAGEVGLRGLLGGCKTRIHGDFHLGQTLKTADDFYLFDFEGEPARPLAERRRKGSPLQDVAGMLRSLGYAAATAQRPEFEPPARRAFLAGYQQACGSGLDAAALRFFETEKAVYELAYERNNRPDWVHIPQAALTRLLA